MEKEVFIQQLMEHLPDDVYDCKVGMDMTINSRVVVDDDGWIWVREAESFKRRKTSINVSDVVEFRRDDYYTEYGSFYIITAEDDGLEFSIQKGFSSALDVEILYCEDGKIVEEALEYFSDNPVE